MKSSHGEDKRERRAARRQQCDLKLGSTSSSSLRASVDNLMETIAADQGLTTEDKDMLAACLAQMELAAKRGDPGIAGRPPDQGIGDSEEGR